MPLALALAIRYLRFRKRQTLVAVLGVALGVGFFIMMATVMQGFQKYLITQLIDFYPHITISDEYRTPPKQAAELVYGSDTALAFKGLKPRDDTQGIRNWPLIEAGLKTIPDIKYAGVLTGSVLLRYGSATASVPVLGFDPNTQKQVINVEGDLLSGKLEDLYTTQNGIIIDEDVADRLGAKQGDTVTAISGRGVRVAVKIVGLTENSRNGHMLLKRVQVLEQKPNRINQVRIRLLDVDAAPQIAKQLEGRFPYKAESWQEANQRIFNVFFVQNIIRYSSVSAIMIVAAFGIFNIISTIIHEKAKDIAILKSLGFGEGKLQAIFIIQGIIMALIGALLGWLLGYGLISALELINMPMGRQSGGGGRTGLLMYKSWTHYAISAGFALCAALFAAYFPSRKASRVNPVEIIRGAG